MPAFTALGTYVAGTLLGLAAGGVAFTVVSSIVAISAAYVTSRIINGNANKGGLGSGAQGGRIQVPPATNNKIPVVYGQAFMNGIITDAYLTSTDLKTNDVMYYCIVLSETCNVSGATYTVNDIYWNDLRLVFDTTAGAEHKVLKGVKKVDGPGEDFEDANFTDHLEVRVYAGNSTAAKQIFPLQSTGNTANAYTYWPDSQWTSANQMEGLVFAIVRLKYSGEKGFTNLAPVTVKITNSASNPAVVLKDYLTSKRYGADVPTAAINTTAMTAWENYCNELISYTDKDATVTTQKRFEINGVIDTNNSVKQNIDSILQNGGAWLSYDVTEGQWRPIIKKAIDAEFTGSISSTTLTVTAFAEGRIEAGQTLSGTGVTAGTTIVSQVTPLLSGETIGQIGRYTVSASQTVGSTTMTTATSGLLSFSDDNILTGITISSTRLDDLYNAYEVEFFDKNNRDQRAYTRDELSTGLNPNEPDNAMRLSLEFTNNSVQADLIANMELRQSRDDLVIEFTASHYGVQAQAGDIIQVTNDIYGWAPKLFRVMRVKEQEGDEGQLTAQIQALEYNGDVYTVEPLTEFTTEANIGIIPVNSSGANANIQTPENDRVSVVETNNTAAVPYVDFVVKVPTAGGPYSGIEVWYAAGPDPDVIGQPVESAYQLLMTHKPPPPDDVFDNGRTIKVTSITGGDTLNTATAHDLVVNDDLYYFETTANGLTQNKVYYVVATPTSTSFKVSATEGGAAIALTNGTGLDLDFDTVHVIRITTLTANQTGQKYYFKARMLVNGYKGGFTDPDSAGVVADPTVPWNPNGGGAGFNLAGAVEGDTIYYDATTTTWKKTSIISINDTTNNVTFAGDLRIDGNDIRDSSGSTCISLTGATPGSIAIQGQLTVVGQNIGTSSGQTNIVLSNTNNNVEILGDLQVSGNDIKSNGGTTAITLSGTNVTIAGDLEYAGGDLRTTNALSSFYYTGTGTHTFNIDDINTTTGNTKTVNIAPAGQSGSITTVNIGSSVSGANSTVNLYNDVIVAGDLTVNGAFNIGSMSIDNRVYYDTATLTTSATTANQVADTWSATTYRTVKYTISITSGSNYHSVEMLVTHNGTTAYQTTFADIYTGSSLSTFAVDISGGNVRLLVTPANAITTYMISKILIIA